MPGKILPRRTVLRRGLQLAAVLAVAPRLMPEASAGESCADPSSESLRSSLGYVRVSADPAKPCSACAFFTAHEGSSSCGECAILSGPADATGYCESWSPRS